MKTLVAFHCYSRVLTLNNHKMQTYLCYIIVFFIFFFCLAVGVFDWSKNWRYKWIKSFFSVRLVLNKKILIKKIHPRTRAWNKSRGMNKNGEESCGRCKTKVSWAVFYRLYRKWTTIWRICLLTIVLCNQREGYN